MMIRQAIKTDCNKLYIWSFRSNKNVSQSSMLWQAALTKQDVHT
jgi:hypothetical protein